MEQPVYPNANEDVTIIRFDYQKKFKEQEGKAVDAIVAMLKEVIGQHGGAHCILLSPETSALLYNVDCRHLGPVSFIISVLLLNASGMLVCGKDGRITEIGIDGLIMHNVKGERIPALPETPSQFKKGYPAVG